jgi:DNA-binding MarR family transcriptional regulator
VLNYLGIEHFVFKWFEIKDLERVMTDMPERLYRQTIQEFLSLYRYLRHYGRKMHQEGISGRKISTLRYLAEVGPLTVGQLGDYLCINDSSTSTTIADLKKRGYVTRTRSPEDNRVVLVEITDQGRELLARIPLGGIPLLREALKTLSPDRLAPIHEALKTMNELVEKK